MGYGVNCEYKNVIFFYDWMLFGYCLLYGVIYLNDLLNSGYFGCIYMVFGCGYCCFVFGEYFCVYK